MKELSTLVDNAAINLLQREILLNTKRQYMKESNTLADKGAINLLQQIILLGTKEQCMKESNTLVSIVINNLGSTTNFQILTYCPLC